MLTDYAVKWKIPDSNRRKIISKMTGVNIDKMIEFSEAVAEDDNQDTTPTHRRLSKTQSSQTGRRIRH